MSKALPANEWHGMDAEPGMPFGRYVDEGDGWQYRVETDGNGRTVEIPERYVGPLAAYGLPATVSDALRRSLDREAGRRENVGVAPRKLRELACTLLEANGPMTREELAQRMGTWTHETAQALSNLRRVGTVDCYASEDAGGRKYL